MAIPAARILEQRSHLVPGRLKVTEHLFEVPRDYSKPSAGNLRLFARSARKAEKPADPEEDEPKKKQLPWMVYLQGGPGFECRPPQANSYTNFILDKGYQLLFLDQRGTGLSTPISASTLGLRGDDPVQADYLKSFRADNIVRDCEAIRQALTSEYPESKRKWSVMGQSFGGYCITTYLSFFPQGLREAFLFGGLPPLVRGPDEVYKRLYKKVQQRNKVYYDKYPEDVDRVKKIIQLLQRFGNSTVRTPSEGSLSARRFQQLGINFGFHSGIDSVHELVLRASNDLELFGHLTRPTIARIEHAQGFDENVIYAILHEPLYCQGTSPDWSAHRVRNEYPDFSTEDLDREGPVYFTGEMVYPWMFEDYAELRKLAGPAELIAKSSDWPDLYDEDQLAKNEVPVYAAAYIDDMYVHWDYAQETASKIRGIKTYITNSIYHDGLRSKMEEVMKHVFDLREDTID
ncbi:MAG: hypothetical protein M1820_002695 [Bogoriella megaspora]|nr:MAG: hypothetical protein M1820_002695 [Bogoriella megaspora]